MDEGRPVLPAQAWPLASCLASLTWPAALLTYPAPPPPAPVPQGPECPWVAGRDVWWHEEVARLPATCAPEWMPSESPLFLLYTSGSTGKPKGVLHSTAGYM